MPCTLNIAKKALATTICLIHLACLPNHSFAQKQGQALIDSVRLRLPAASDDTAKVKMLNAISFTFFFINADSGIAYGQRALDLATRLGWDKGVATAYKNMGNSFMGKADYDMALDQYSKALAVFEAIGDDDGQSKVLGNIGNIYDDKGDYTRALEYEFRALKICERRGDKAGMARIYNTMGSLYETPQKYEEALNYYQKAANMHAALGDRQSMALDMGNVGNAYAGLKRYDSALSCDTRALAIFAELGDSMALANKLLNIGNVYYRLKEFKMALRYNIEALRTYEHVDDKQAIGVVYGAISGIYQAEAEQEINRNKASASTPHVKDLLNKATTNSLKAIEIFAAIGALNELRETYDGLAQQYELAGNYKEALNANKRSVILKDSLFNKDKHIQFADLEKQRANDEKKFAQKETEVQQKLNKEFVQHSRERTILFTVGMLLLLAAVVLVLRQRRRSEQLLLNILPAKIAERLKRKEHPIADVFENASVIFIDMIGFTQFSQNKDPKVIVSILNDIFTRFDAIAEKHGLEKIKTIGDCYMAVAGLPEPNKDHAKMAAAMAMDVKRAMAEYEANGTPIQFRIGIDCGSVVAGVIGKNKFIYDIWGDTVNTASRMETTGLPGEIYCTDNFKNSLPSNYIFASRGQIEIKGKGQMNTWLLSAIG